MNIKENPIRKRETRKKGVIYKFRISDIFESV